MRFNKKKGEGDARSGGTWLFSVSFGVRVRRPPLECLLTCHVSIRSPTRKEKVHGRSFAARNVDGGVEVLSDERLISPLTVVSGGVWILGIENQLVR